MATINFLEDVKVAFDRVFNDQDKSSIIGEFMREALAQETRPTQAEEIFRRLTQRRAQRPSVSNEEVQAARVAGRA